MLAAPWEFDDLMPVSRVKQSNSQSIIDPSI
jgi:hypothetical protein